MSMTTEQAVNLELKRVSSRLRTASAVLHEAKSFMPKDEPADHFDRPDRRPRDN